MQHHYRRERRQQGGGKRRQQAGRVGRSKVKYLEDAIHSRDKFAMSSACKVRQLECKSRIIMLYGENTQAAYTCATYRRYTSEWCEEIKNAHRRPIKWVRSMGKSICQGIESTREVIRTYFLWFPFIVMPLYNESIRYLSVSGKISLKCLISSN